jgi:hypothetical protein
MLRTLLFCLLTLLYLPTVGRAQSPYAGQESREIKSLSAQEISDYLSGKGMGLAKAAELNGYPGPAHVLEFAAELKLSADQKAKTEALFKRMQGTAIPLGKELVAEERALDRLFASHSVTPETLKTSLARIATLQGQVRQVHLQAHLEQIALLRPEQVQEYNRLRGYGQAAESEGHGQRAH